MNSTQSKAATANGTAIRKRCPVASPNAPSNTARIGPGSVARSGIWWLPCASSVMPRDASWSVTVAATWLASTAPRALTPIEPPIERKKATTELAAPMSLCAVLFWTASTRFCMVAPSPSPITAIEAPTYTSGVASSIRESSSRPTMTRAMPPTR